MTPNEIRIAIAESQGAVWRLLPIKKPTRFLCIDPKCDCKLANGSEQLADGSWLFDQELVPNYPESKDAMQSVLMGMDADTRFNFNSHLTTLLAKNKGTHRGLVYVADGAIATAAQLAEAYLRATGRFIEDRVLAPTDETSEDFGGMA